MNKGKISFDKRVPGRRRPRPVATDCLAVREDWREQPLACMTEAQLDQVFDEFEQLLWLPDGPVN